MASTTEGGLSWIVDDLVSFRGRAWVGGWLWHRDRRVVGVSALVDGESLADAKTGLERPDPHGVASGAPVSSGFAAELSLPEGRHADELHLGVTFDDGTTEVLKDLYGPATDLDRYHKLEASFWEQLRTRPRGRVLELGSRDRSGNVRRELARPHDYVGADILEGPNVDLVCDVHEIDAHVKPGSITACFAVATFEHLLMPWKAILAINRVLEPGGLLWISTHQTFPLHEMPWDYWRYSSDGWRGLLNPRTGFAITDVAMGEPAMVVPARSHAPLRDMERGLAYLGASVLAQKTGRTALRWPVPTREVAAGEYPR